MCTVSNMGDDWTKKRLPDAYPWVSPWITPNSPNLPAVPFPGTFPPPYATKEEVEALRNEVQELKKLLLAAKEFDKNTGQPDCEMDDKVKIIKTIAELLGVDMTEVFKK